MSKGLFISLEGVDCSGKSTLANGLMERYADRDVRLYKFPSHEKYGCMAKEVLHSDSYRSDEYMMLCLMDMKDVYEKQIKRDLENGAIVICDRYVHSTAAYQSKLLKGERPIYASTIASVGFRVLGLPLPDITFFLDANFAAILDRLARKGDRDAIEKRLDKKMILSINRSYRTMMRYARYGNLVLLDATNLEQQILNNACESIEEKLMGV